MELDHQHFMATAFIERPPVTVDEGNKWLLELVRLVGMQVLIAPQSVYCTDEGNEGLTGIVVLSTSHASFHAWTHPQDKPPHIQVDLYSCKAFDPKVVLDHIDQAFGTQAVAFQVIDRNIVPVAA